MEKILWKIKGLFDDIFFGCKINGDCPYPLIEPSSEFFYQMFLAPEGFTLFEVKDLESWKNQPKNLSHCPTNSK